MTGMSKSSTMVRNIASPVSWNYHDVNKRRRWSLTRPSVSDIPWGVIVPQRLLNALKIETSGCRPNRSTRSCVAKAALCLGNRDPATVAPPTPTLESQRLPDASEIGTKASCWRARSQAASQRPLNALEIETDQLSDPGAICYRAAKAARCLGNRDQSPRGRLCLGNRDLLHDPEDLLAGAGVGPHVGHHQSAVVLAVPADP